MNNLGAIFGKLLYGLFFCALLPLGLWFWARQTSDLIRYPAIEAPFAGTLLLTAGIALIVSSMSWLRIRGKGLPMNAFPPPEFVSSGPYRLFRHPIYVGFGAALAGFFLLQGSAGGLWLVTPVTCLGMAALVWGYESPDLQRRFPGSHIHTIFDLPADEAVSCNIADRFTALFRVLWLLVVVNVLTMITAPGIPPLWGGPLSGLPANSGVLFWVLSALPVLAAAFGLTQKDSLRQWAVSNSVSLLGLLCLALLLPAAGAQYIPVMYAAPPAAIPAFLIVHSFYWLWQEHHKNGFFFFLAALVCFAAAVAGSRSAPLHTLIGLGLSGLGIYHRQIWLFLKKGAENIANSWKEWNFGWIRVINHGFYVGFGTFFCVLLSGGLAGSAYAWAILVFTVIGIVSAALWAQFIEGSEKLKRPFGYYGSVVSVPLCCLAMWAMGADVWVVVGVVSVVMPWGQAIGRLRCLVNGCCHGSPTDNPNLGIRYFHPRSRVCHLSHLKGALLHPTQLYSIVWLTGVGFILLALWLHHFTAPFIFGMYLIFTGLGRFVEEAYRGEVQTPIYGGLRLYQWTAIASVAVGIVLTTWHITPAMVYPGLSLNTVIAAILGGAFVAFAMGIDFPRSNARFSRLV